MHHRFNSATRSGEPARRFRRVAAIMTIVFYSCAATAQESGAFDILEYQIEGNTVLPTLAIERAVYPHLGERRGIAAVQAAREALEKAYHDAGYLTVFVEIPEQKVDGGIVRLKATEGQVDRLRVRGSRYYSLGEIKAGAPSLAEGSVPNFNEVQKDLTALSRSPDRQITPVLRPSKTPGRVEVDLQVKDQLPLHGSLELNDRYSANTSKLRLAGNISYDNLWQKQHKLAIGFQIAPENSDDAKIASATYLLPQGREGRMLAFYGVVSRSNLAVAGDISVLGNADILGARWILPLPVRAAAEKGHSFFHSLTLGVDYKDFKENILFGADTLATPIRYVPFSLAYNATMQSPVTRTSAGLTTSFGMRGLADKTIECTPGNFQDQFECKRNGAKSNFISLKSSLNHEHNLAEPFVLAVKAEAQAASGPLISNEQFSAGGADSVRGYLESEALGDYGVALGAELRRNWASEFAGGLSGDWHLFTEGAQLRLIDALPGQISRYSLLAAGLGVRVNAKSGLRANLELGYPLRDGPVTKKGDARAHFRLGYEF